MKSEKKYTNSDIGTLVSIPHFPDRANPCDWSGCPTYRQAYGIVLEIFEDHRLICMVEGNEQYFFSREVKPMKEEK